MSMQILPGRYPGEVTEYLKESRQCRVSIPGITDGADVMPLAEIEYPAGDKSAHDKFATEIEFLTGDTVWLSFIGGDSRYPIITGYRNPNTGNGIDWRRFHHANIELLADETIRLITTDGESRVEVKPDGITVQTSGNATVQADGNATVDATQIIMNGGEADGVVCKGHICALTGLGHIDGSSTVKGSF